MNAMLYCIAVSIWAPTCKLDGETFATQVKRSRSRVFITFGKQIANNAK